VLSTEGYSPLHRGRSRPSGRRVRLGIVAAALTTCLVAAGIVLVLRNPAALPFSAEVTGSAMDGAAAARGTTATDPAATAAATTSATSGATTPGASTPGASTPGAADGATVVVGDLAVQRLATPSRTVVRDSRGVALAVFTDGARTVRLIGRVRTFSEPAFTAASVTTDAWVRLAPKAWSKGAEYAAWFRPWLTKALADTSPDVLAVAMQYVHGAPQRTNGSGLRYAGDASYGPLSASDPDGRAEGSDFLDYLGVSWTFPDRGSVSPKPDRYGDADCSGFVRLVYGYRLGYPLLGRNEPGNGLPRRAFAMSEFGPGAVVVANSGKPAGNFDRVQAGDLVFFDTDQSTANQNDHSGIYLGRDHSGHHRFVSSRSKADGPTFGDLGGAAILDGGGYWSVRFRDSRRL